jgi:hypothetical protein
MNNAEAVIRRLFGMEAHQAQEGVSVDAFDSTRQRLEAFYHPQIEFSLFGETGVKEHGRGRAQYLAFVGRCAAALSARSDEIVSITPIDEQMVVVRARAWRKSAATGAELRYEWVMLFRVEDGLVTYGVDMLDRDAQQFWGRIRG